MFRYKTVEIPNGMWSGKPSQNLMAVMNHHGMHQWRFHSMSSLVKGGKTYTVLLFEKEVANDYYKTHEIEPLPPEYDPEDFV